VAELEGELSAY